MSDYRNLIQVLGLLELKLVEPKTPADSNDTSDTQEPSTPLEAENIIEKVQLASSRLQSGSSNEALTLLQEVLDAENPTPSTYRPTMMFARELVASGLYAEGRHSEALERFKEVAQLQTDLLATEHPLTLQNKFNIGIITWVLGRNEEACQALDETYRAQEKANTLHHRGTIATMENLAFMYHFSGRSWEAQNVQKRVLEIRLKHNLPSDSELLKSSILLSTIYRDMEWWKEAETTYRLVVDGRTALQGPDSPATLASMTNLARSIQEQGRLDEAEQLCNKIGEHLDRSSSSDLLPALRNKFHLSTIFRDKGEYMLAFDLQKEVLETEKRLYGEDSEDTLTTMAGLVETLRQANRLDEAETISKDLISIYERMLGPHHPASLHHKIDLGVLYSQMDLWDKVETVIDSVVVDLLQSPARNDDELHNRLREMTNLLLQHGKLSAWNRFVLGEPL